MRSIPVTAKPPLVKFPLPRSKNTREAGSSALIANPKAIALTAILTGTGGLRKKIS